MTRSGDASLDQSSEVNRLSVKREPSPDVMDLRSPSPKRAKTDRTRDQERPASATTTSSAVEGLAELGTAQRPPRSAISTSRSGQAAPVRPRVAISEQLDTSGESARSPVPRLVIKGSIIQSDDNIEILDGDELPQAVIDRVKALLLKCEGDSEDDPFNWRCLTNTNQCVYRGLKRQRLEVGSVLDGRESACRRCTNTNKPCVRVNGVNEVCIVALPRVGRAGLSKDNPKFWIRDEVLNGHPTYASMRWRKPWTG